MGGYVLLEDISYKGTSLMGGNFLGVDVLKVMFYGRTFLRGVTISLRVGMSRYDWSSSGMSWFNVCVCL